MNRIMTICAAAVLFAAICVGQAAPAKKSYTFRGKVEAVSASAKNLTVNGENVEGWMGAMTMVYNVDDPEVLKKIKAGDQITATVYAGDYVLYKVQVVPKAAGGSKSKK